METRNRISVIWILLLWTAIFLPGLFRPALLDDADSVHAEAAREMVATGDWVTLHANGLRYLEKAPLPYWLMAISIKLFGVHEWAIRLPFALAALALAFVIQLFSLRAYASSGGEDPFSGPILLTSFGLYIFTRITIPEVLVSLWLAVTFLLFFRSFEEERPSRLVCWGMAIATALNVLSKGLIGVVFPACIIAGYLVATQRLSHLKKLRLVSSGFIFLLVAVPWHIAASLANPPQGQAKGFAWFYFINEHVLRYLGKRFPPDYDKVPLLIFWALLFTWLFPWCVYIVRPVRDWLREKSTSATSSAVLFCLIWAGFILVFFSFSTRQEYYTIPALPALAVLADCSWARLDRPKGVRCETWILAALGLLVFLVASLLLWRSRGVSSHADLAELLLRNPQLYALSFGHFFDLTPAAMALFRLPLLIFSGCFLAGSCAAVWCEAEHRFHAARSCLALMMVGMLLASWIALLRFEPVLSSRTLALTVKARFHPGDLIVVNDEYEPGSTMNFYTGQQVHLLNGRNKSNMWFGSLFPDAPPIFEDDASLAAKWDSGHQRIFFWVEDANPPRVLTGKILTPNFVVARSGGKTIYSNLAD